jgi:hypothetical protein
MDPDADAVLPTLILFDAAAVIVADVRGADWHVVHLQKIYRSPEIAE